MLDLAKLWVHEHHRAGDALNPITGDRTVEKAAGQSYGASAVGNHINLSQFFLVLRTADFANVSQGSVDVSPRIVCRVRLLGHNGSANSVRDAVCSVAGFAEVADCIPFNCREGKH